MGTTVEKHMGKQEFKLKILNCVMKQEKKSQWKKLGQNNNRFFAKIYHKNNRDERGG